MNSAVWDDVWAAFCTRFHTIRYDRRGYGWSPETKSPYYEADDLAALLNSRKVAHAALVASSHGGQVALEFTLRYPAYVSDLVVVGPAATGFPYSEYFLMRERANSQSNKVEDLIEASVHYPFLIVPGHDAVLKATPSSSGKTQESLHYLAFLNYPELIRRSLSTTNVVEAINGQLEIMRRNSGGYFHSQDTLKLKLGLAISSLEQGRWKSPGRFEPAARLFDYTPSAPGLEFPVTLTERWIDSECAVTHLCHVS